jgi:hypothetical protein
MAFCVSPSFGKCSAEIRLGSRVSGLELDGSRQLLRRGWKIPGDRLRDSEIVVQSRFPFSKRRCEQRTIKLRLQQVPREFVF